LVWDCHLKDDDQHALQAIKDFRRLSLSEFRTMIKEINVKRAVLGGGEPTIDKELPDIIGMLNTLDVQTHLLTNGYILNEKFIEKLEEVGLLSTYVSIKAYDDDTHRFYTGQTNRPVLDNFKLLSKSRIKLMAESIFIPGLIEYNEIERIARFIASVDPSISYRIDGFIPINDTPWRAPSPEEMIKASEIAKRHLENVHYIHSETKIKREVVDIYPKIKRAIE
jgi:pyruvate-formate lyase-activating enzyme